MNKIYFLSFAMLFSYISYSNTKYEEVANHIINNLKTQKFYEMGIKDDTLIDVNKDGIIDTVEFKPRYSSYNIADSTYYSLHVYGWTVMEEINDKIYIYDVDRTDSEIDIYISYSVYEIQKDFTKKKVIEFRNEDSVYVVNNEDKSFEELKSQYLKENNLLECLSTERKLTKENSVNYGWSLENNTVHLFSDVIRGEIPIGKDTIICMGKYTADRNPYSLEYVRINSNNKPKYKSLNKLLDENRVWSQTKVYKYEEFLVLYKHGWLDTDQPYEIIVVDINNKDTVEIIETFEFDYRYKITPVYDENEFIYEEEVY